MLFVFCVSLSFKVYQKYIISLCVSRKEEKVAMRKQEREMKEKMMIESGEGKVEERARSESKVETSSEPG